MVALFAALALAPPPMAVVTARIYKPGKARSFYRVYLWRGPSQGLQAVSPDDHDCRAAQWSGRDHIVWMEETGGHIQFRMAAIGSRTSQVLPCAFSTKKVEADRRDKNWYLGPPVEIRQQERGRPRWEFQEFLLEERNGKMVRRERPYLEVHDPYDDSVYTVSGEPYFKFADNVTLGRVYERGGKLLKTDIRDDSNPEYIPGRSDQETFLFCGWSPYKTKLFRGRTLWRIDWKAGTAKPVVDGPSQLDFQPASPWWSGATSAKETRPLGNIQVWADWGYVGNWRTGQTWSVTDKLADVGSVFLRPSR